jgi:hypothetical protein
MKELFGITHIGEEEVPNVKVMRIGEDEVSLSQPVTDAVPPEEEEVLVPQGPTLVVLSEEEGVLAPPRVVVPPQGPAVAVPLKEEVSQGPPCRGPTRGRGGPSPPVVVPPEGRGCLVSVPPLVSSLPFFFSHNRRRFFSPFFLIHTVDL